jgi:hypothetical protein
MTYEFDYCRLVQEERLLNFQKKFQQLATYVMQHLLCEILLTFGLSGPTKEQ